MGNSWPLLGRSWPLLGRSWAALGRSWAPLEGLLAALGALLTTFDDPSWRKLGSKMPSETILGRKHGFTKSIGKRKEKHTFLIPRWLRNAPRWPQDGSKTALGRSWTALGPSSGDLRESGSDPGGLLERSWSDLAGLGANLESLGAILAPLGAILGRSWAPKEGQTGKGVGRGRRHSREAGPPLETFYESFCF